MHDTVHRAIVCCCETSECRRRSFESDFPRTISGTSGTDGGMSGNEASGNFSVDVGAILARARRVSVDIAALTDQSLTLLSEQKTAVIPEDAPVDDAAIASSDGEHAGDYEVSLEDVLTRFKAVQSTLSSIQEDQSSPEPAALKRPFAPTARGLQAVGDLREICANSMQAFVSAAAIVSMDLISQAGHIQEAVQQQLALFELLYVQGATLSDEQVIDTLEKLSAAIAASSVDPLSVAPSLAPHVSMLSGAASGIDWIASSSTPKEQITDTLNAVPVFGKRIMERGANDAELVKALQCVLRRLLQHVSQFHPNHVNWDCSQAALGQASDMSIIKRADNALHTDANKIFQSDMNFAELFETFYRESVEPWLSTGSRMEEMVQRQMKLCQMAFKEQQKILGLAMVHRQPQSDEEWSKALGHLNMLLDAIEEMGNQRGEACIDKMRMYKPNCSSVLFARAYLFSQGCWRNGSPVLVNCVNQCPPFRDGRPIGSVSSINPCAACVLATCEFSTLFRRYSGVWQHSHSKYSSRNRRCR